MFGLQGVGVLASSSGGAWGGRLAWLPLAAVLLAGLACAPAAFAEDYRQDADAADHGERYGYGGQLVQVNGRRMYIRCVGSAPGPLVVMDSGMGGSAPEWFQVQDMLHDIRTCSYDRSGLGYSSATSEPRISSLLAEELHELLQHAGQPGPYILVGHSFGGYNIRYFAGAWPGDVAGMVLVDSSHPEQFERIPSLPGDAEIYRGRPRVDGNVKFRPVVVTQFKGDGMIDFYPPELRETVRNLMLSRKSMYTGRQEFLGFMHSASELDWVRFPKDLPLAVVHRGRRVWQQTPIGDSREQEWLKLQEELAALSSDSLVLEARNSGHMVHMEEPEVVVDAIRWAFRRSCLNRSEAEGSGCSAAQVWQSP